MWERNISVFQVADNIVSPVVMSGIRKPQMRKHLFEKFVKSSHGDGSRDWLSLAGLIGCGGRGLSGYLKLNSRCSQP